MPDPFPDFVRAPNITLEPTTYRAENMALLRDGRLDAALRSIAPDRGRRLPDVVCGRGFWLSHYAHHGARATILEADLAWEVLRWVDAQRARGGPGAAQAHRRLRVWGGRCGGRVYPEHAAARTRDRSGQIAAWGHPSWRRSENVNQPQRREPKKVGTIPYTTEAAYLAGVFAGVDRAKLLRGKPS